MLLLAAACAGPVLAPAPPSGELIAYGGGPGGARDACFTCHGLKGEGDAATPRLSGLNAGYLFKQLNDYAGERRNDGAMSPIAARLSEAERRAVAEYYAERAFEIDAARVPPPPVYAEGSPERGVRACAECHGDEGEGAGLGNPAIAGQPREYTLEQLRFFKRSMRRNDPQDVMGSASRPLMEEEIEAIADYLERS